MAKIKISELDAAAALDGTEEIPIVQDGETVKTTAQDIADLGGGGSSYLKYVALLSQSGTDAPVATVLENTLGGTVVWGYIDVGIYSATLSGAFTTNKTYISLTSQGGDMITQRGDADTIYVNGFDSSGSPQSGNGFFFEIRVYP